MNPELENHHEDYHRAVAGVGLTGLLLGLLDRNDKKTKAKYVNDHMKDQFALKDSILSIVTQEINDLTFLNQNL